MKITTKVASAANMYLAEKRDWIVTCNTGRYQKRLSARAERHAAKRRIQNDIEELAGDLR